MKLQFSNKFLLVKSSFFMSNNNTTSSPPPCEYKSSYHFFIEPIFEKLLFQILISRPYFKYCEMDNIISKDLSVVENNF